MDKLGIWNMAIGQVGGTSVMSFSDDSLEAEQCELNYDIAREFCLESRDWTFAATYRQLATVVADSPSEFSYAFQLPSDCILVRIVSDNEDLRSPIIHQKDGGLIVTDSSVVYIKYTKNVVNTSLFSPAFSIAVAHKLAELIASAITGDKDLKRSLLAESELLLDNGGSTDGMQGTPRPARASKLVSARFYGGRVGRYGLGRTL